MTDNLSIPIQVTFAQLLDAVDQLSKAEQHQLLLHVLRRHEEDNLIVTHFGSEAVLAKDWGSAIEGESWGICKRVECRSALDSKEFKIG